ncbi:MAG: hypothetical protein ABIH23_34430, partial [bacterium]
MNRQLIKSTLLASIMLSLAGCGPELFIGTFSWNPDGRYLAFVRPYDNGLWIWDSRTGQTTRHAKGFAGEEITYCKWIPLDNDIVFGVGSGDDMRLYKLDIKPDAAYELVSEGGLLNFDVSKDGKYLYYTRKHETEETNTYEMWEKDIAHPENEKLLFSNKGEVIFPSVDESRSRILYETGSNNKTEICVFDMVSDTTRTVLTGGETPFWWPTWLDQDTFIYASSSDNTDGADELGSLCVYSFTDSATREIVQNIAASPSTNVVNGVSLPEGSVGGGTFNGKIVDGKIAIGEKKSGDQTSKSEIILKTFVFPPPSVSLDGKTVVVTTVPTDQQEEKDQGWLSVAQIALVDVNSGKTRILTNEAFGAGWAAISPTGKRIAYLSPVDGENATVRVLDIETNRQTMVWCDEEERLLSMADSFLQSDDAHHAMEVCRDLLTRFPETRFSDFAYYHTMMLYLRPPFLDLDQAFMSLRRVEHDSLRSQARPLIWREQDKIVTDPAEDWIQTYGTEDSEKEFEFKTDLARDLLGIWARCGTERLYIRLDYNSARDLEGLVFQDTLLLFDYDSPDQGYRQISQ